MESAVAQIPPLPELAEGLDDVQHLAGLLGSALYEATEQGQALGRCLVPKQSQAVLEAANGFQDRQPHYTGLDTFGSAELLREELVVLADLASSREEERDQ